MEGKPWKRLVPREVDETFEILHGLGYEFEISCIGGRISATHPEGILPSFYYQSSESWLVMDNKKKLFLNNTQAHEAAKQL